MKRTKRIIRWDRIIGSLVYTAMVGVLFWIFLSFIDVNIHNRLGCKDLVGFQNGTLLQT